MSSGAIYSVLSVGCLVSTHLKPTGCFEAARVLARRKREARGWKNRKGLDSVDGLCTRPCQDAVEN